MGRKFPIEIGFLAFGMLAVAGCSRVPTESTESGPTKVSASRPIMRDITDFRIFTGTTAAPNSVDVQARVTGYLVKLPFVEGSAVKAADVLAEIDPRPYEAKLEAAQGEVAVNEAQLNLAQKEYDRAKAIRAQNAGAVSQQELDMREAKVEEAAAAVQAAKANRAQYELDLEFTMVHTPIDGRVSRYYLTPGNLVTQNETLITTVVSQDPIYVYFDVDEQTMLEVLRSMYSGKTPPARSRQISVFVGLQGDEGFPHEGKVDFANNEVDASTGTIVVRGVFPNPANKAGVRLFLPGMFVRVKLPIGAPRKRPLVAEKAIGNDQGQSFVYTVDEHNQVHYGRVELGRMTEDGLWVVEDGVTPNERVIVSGIQFAKPGEKVEVDEVPMPTTGSSPQHSEPSQSQDGKQPPKDTKPTSTSAK